MTHYSHCPSCGNSSFAHVFTATDFSVTGEQFPVVECTNCGLLLTQDVPSENEISRYYRAEHYISHSDTSKGIINKIYHQVRGITIRRKRDLIRRHTKQTNGSILDIGSGTGSFLEVMRAANWQITGIEPDETARGNSKSARGIDARSPDEMKEIPSATFDAITMWHVLEHVHQLSEELSIIRRLLKDDGVLMIAVPNHTSYDASHYDSYWAAWDVPRHLYHFSPQSMAALLSRHGFQISHIKPMWFDSFYISMLSEKYKTGRSNIFRAVMIGAMSNLKALSDAGKCSSLTYIIRKA